MAAVAESAAMRSYDSLSSQIRNLEATVDQQLSQATASLRKDMASREDRLTRRMDSDRKEQASTLFKLKRDLTVQQTSDLAAQEDRITRRLDSERREQKEALTELRRELNSQQAAIAKLIAGGGASPASPSQAHSADVAALEQTVKHSEAAMADLRRELGSFREQQEQLSRQASKSEVAVNNLRKEFLSQQGEEVRQLQEQLSRSTQDLAKTFQELANVVEDTEKSLRSELRREIQKLRSDVGSPEEVAAPAGRLSELEKQLEDVRRQSIQGGPSQGLDKRLQALEAKVADTENFATQRVVNTDFASKGKDGEDISKLKVVLDETKMVAEDAQKDILRLAQDLAEQRAHSEHVAAAVRKQRSPSDADAGTSSKLTEVVKSVTQEVERTERRLLDMLRERTQALDSSCRSDIQAIRSSLTQTELSLSRLSQDLSRERDERCKSLADLACKAEDACAAAARHDKRLSAQEEAVASLGRRKPEETAPSTEAGDSASEVFNGGRASDAAASMALGAETHVALAACVGELDAELRVELAERLNGVISDTRKEIDLRCGAFEEQVKEDLNKKLTVVEKLEVRVGRIESARLDLRLGALESAAQRASNFGGSVRAGEESSLFAARAPMATSSFGATLPVQPSLDNTQPVLDLQPSPEVADAPDDSGSMARSLFQGQADFGEAAPNGDGFEPLISDDLKSRLEHLVEQVKETLNATQVNQTPFLEFEGQNFEEQQYREQNYEALQQNYDQYELPAQPSYQPPYQQYQPMGQYHGSVALPLGREHDRMSDMDGGRAASDYGGNYQTHFGSAQVPLPQAMPGDYAYTGSLDGDGGGYDGGGFENGYAQGFQDAQQQMVPTPVPVYGPAHVTLGPPTVVGIGQPVVHSVSVTTRAPSPHRMRNLSPVREASPVRGRGGSLVAPVAHGRHRSPSPVRASRGAPVLAPDVAIPQSTLMPSMSFVPVTPLQPSGSFVGHGGMQLPYSASYVPTPAPKAYEEKKDDEDSGSSDNEAPQQGQGLISKLFKR